MGFMEKFLGQIRASARANQQEARSVYQPRPVAGIDRPTDGAECDVRGYSRFRSCVDGPEGLPHALPCFSSCVTPTLPVLRIFTPYCPAVGYSLRCLLPPH